MILLYKNIAGKIPTQGSESYKNPAFQQPREVIQGAKQQAAVIVLFPGAQKIDWVSSSGTSDV